MEQVKGGEEADKKVKRLELPGTTKPFDIYFVVIEQRSGGGRSNTG